ncbi:MAG: phosphoesterase [Bryobacterales bacterium]|nr:phosphoesterase [Bryobacterales bacterium]
MLIRVLYHDHCFDGAASAAYFSRFMHDHFHPDAKFAYTGMAHKASDIFSEDLFDGNVNAIVDFKYCATEKLTWWFDHHQSAFLSPEDEQHFLRDTSGKKFLDAQHKSCAGYIAEIARTHFGYDPADLKNLVYWAEIVDSANYPNAEFAVALAEPALKLVLVIEGSKSAEIMHKIIGWMSHLSFDEIMARPEIQELYKPLYDKHVRSIDLIRERARVEGGVAYFDLSGEDIVAYNKFIPYFLFPEATYTVSVSTPLLRTKVSVGSNPWAKQPIQHNLATICERYGGGGHPRVGAISFEPGAVDAARETAQEVVQELQSTPSKAA